MDERTHVKCLAVLAMTPPPSSTAGTVTRSKGGDSNEQKKERKQSRWREKRRRELHESPAVVQMQWSDSDSKRKRN